MGRHYAGVLGAVAFVTIVTRGLLERAEFDQTLKSAILFLVIFSFVGFLVGRLAGWIIFESVRSQWTGQRSEPVPAAGPGTTTTT